jgi:cytochrome c-type biogenesis protein CcmH
MRRLPAVLLFCLLAWVPAHAVNPEEMLADPVLEQRARDIGAQLRCLVCQNQSIDDSNSGLARDLRLIVRERLTAGDSDAQVMQFVETRFGHYALLKPPYVASTYLLWWGPLVVFALAFAIFVIGFRMRRRNGVDGTASAPLSAEELLELEKSGTAE